MFVKFSTGFVVNTNHIVNFFVNEEHPFVTVEFVSSSGADNRVKTISIPIAEYNALINYLDTQNQVIQFQ